MKIRLRLYIMGSSALAQQASRNIEHICQQALGEDYELELIDVLEKPEMAEQDKILATPTLVRCLPLPMRKIVGDLSNYNEVLLGLDIIPHSDFGSEVSK